MDRETIAVELTAEDRALLLRYGYPFDGIERALKACEAEDIAVVPLDVFELERLIGDLCISINDMEPGPVQDQLLDLCDRLEYADRTGDGMLFEF